MGDNTAITTMEGDSEEHTEKNATSFVAASKVLETYELLESVLLALPGEDILIAAHVCKTWHSLITSSSAIDKRVRATPFFMLEQQQHQDEHSKPDLTSSADISLNATTHLMLEGCDVVIRRVGVAGSPAAFESIALLRNATQLSSNQKIVIKFLKIDEAIPYLTQNDYAILRWGWTGAFCTRFFNPTYHQGLLRRLDYGLLSRMYPDQARKMGSLYSQRDLRDLDHFRDRVELWKAQGKLGSEEYARAKGYIGQMVEKGEERRSLWPAEHDCV